MRIAIVDGNNLARAAYHVKGDLKNSRGVYTGLTLTFLDMLRTMTQYVPVYSITVAWDSPNVWRYDVFGEYKANRVKKDSLSTHDFGGQKRLLQSVLHHFGVAQIEGERLEADDLAGLWAKNSPPNMPLVFCSNDDDWLQMLRHPNAIVYRPKDKSTVSTLEEFQRETLCRTIDELVDAKAIMGESGDNIPGIDGVGIKTALKYLRGEMKATASKYDEIRDWIENPDGFARSRKLFQLGVDDPPVPILTTESPRIYDETAIMEMLKDFEARSKIDRFDTFVGPFRKLEAMRRERSAKSAGASPQAVG